MILFRSSLLNRVRGLLVRKSVSGSVICYSPIQTCRIVSSQFVYFNSESKPSNVAQSGKDAKQELKLSKSGMALDFLRSDWIAPEDIAIQPDCEIPGTLGIAMAEDDNTIAEDDKTIAEDDNTFDSPSTISSQINCAKQQLNSIVKQLQETDETYSSKMAIIQEISSRLDDGRVPPIFHAFGMPGEWPGGKRLCFSLDPVKPGDVRKKSILYLDSDAENKAKVVGDDLKAVDRIKEEGCISWYFDDMATEWVVNLVNQDAQMRGSNVESTDVGCLLELIYDSSEQMLLTRPQSRGVVATIFNRISEARAGTTTALTGLPGIGKSWTLLYVLQQALLYEGMFILFITGGKWFNLFHRRSGRLYAWRVQGAALSDFLSSEETLAIFDSYEENKIRLRRGKRHLIYVASSDETDFMKRRMKKLPDTLYDIGPWTEDELRAAFHDFEKEENLLIADVLERFKYVGGLPRNLMRKDRFEYGLIQIVKSLLQLRRYKDLEKSMRNATTELKTYSDTVSGNLYSAVPRMSMEVDLVDYDGKCFMDKDRVVRWASQRIFEFVLNKYRKEALTNHGKRNDFEFVEIGRAAEYWFIHDLQHVGCTFDCWKMKENTDDAVGCTTSLEIPQNQDILCPKTASETYQYIAKLFEDSSNNSTLIVCPPNFTAAYAIGFGHRVFQVATSKNHSLNPDGMKKILVSAGILAASGQEINEGAQPITFYWVVPFGNSEPLEKSSTKEV